VLRFHASLSPTQCGARSFRVFIHIAQQANLTNTFTEELVMLLGMTKGVNRLSFTDSRDRLAKTAGQGMNANDQSPREPTGRERTAGGLPGQTRIKTGCLSV